MAILLVNVGIFAGPLNQSYFRPENLPQDDKVDIFKACLSSIASSCDFSQVIVKFHLDTPYKHREQELIDHIKKTFSNPEIDTKRNEYQKDWIETYNSLKDDKTIFYCCNHDHFFVNKPEYFQKCLDAFEEWSGKFATLFLTSFPEISTATKSCKDKIIGRVGPLLQYKMETFDSFILITKQLFKNWWVDEELPNIPFPRSDYHPYSLDKFKKDIPDQFAFAPLQEIFCHIDGYSTLHNNGAYLNDFPPFALDTIPKNPRSIKTLKNYCSPEWYWAYEAENETS